MDQPDNVEPLIEALDPTMPVWVLVDPMLGEPIPVGGSIECRESAWSRPVNVVELSARIELPVPLHPYLVALNGVDDPWLVQTWHMAEKERLASWADGLAGRGRGPWRIGGWLQSPIGVGQVTQSLRALMTLRTQMHTTARYLRAGDRRTMDALCLIAGPARMTAALGVVRRWVWADSCGAMACLERLGEDRDEGLRLGSAEWKELSLTELLHPCMARWCGEANAHAERPRRQDTLRRLDHALRAVHAAREEARRHPLWQPSPDDLIAWATMSLLHPGFETAPATSRWLQSWAETAAEPSLEPPEPFDIHCHTLRNQLARSPAHQP